MVASGRTRLARIGKVTDGIVEAATRGRVGRTSSAIRGRVERTSSATAKVEITRVATGTRKAAAAVAAGGVVGIARTAVTAAVAATWTATTSR
jgi:hypothetical protein